ncbi:MAG: NAD(P)/FAD-dependent oxidoreductase [Simplicispira suum]|uniref:NAD(P)/FAD-dependent oxidoreductase n=1 Tax=Simplicispira suum TaxID=2109915 RepID=UPI001C6D1FE9|nr:NAD(P)/FAD-dependent oxidoreductase [Simplicispira suum]MBW7834609.1 NAD(P)/FAD-dependent oxidoreductase [Simplicispira suum]
MEKTDAVVIGAGPVGLFQVFQLGLQGLACHVIDALPQAGGQCAELYGDKPIYDIPGIKVCTGQELTDRLLDQITPFAPHWHLGQQASMLEPQPGGGFLVQANRGTQLHARAVFIAAGVGAFLPRALKLPGLEPFEGTQLRYRFDDGESLAGQNLVVHGGGEDAVVTAIRCAGAPEHLRPARTILQHRRDVFDAPPAVLEQLRALRAAGLIQVAIGVPSDIEQAQGRLSALLLTTPEGALLRLPMELLLVRLGLVPRLGPIADWGMALERKQLVVDPATFATSAPGVYAVGDTVAYPGKRKLIVSGFHEATLAAFGAAEWLAGQKIPLEYTTSSARLQRLLGV